MQNDAKCSLKRRAGKRPGASAALAAGAAVLLLCASARGAEIEKLSGQKLKGKIVKETDKYVSISVRIGRRGSAVKWGVLPRDEKLRG